MTANAINTPLITLGGPFTTSGPFSLTATLTGNSNVTFPTSGTLATTGGSVGNIIKVVSTASTTQFTTTSSTYVDVTGLSVTITPSSSSNKILIFVSINAVASAQNALFQLVRDSTAISLGAVAGSQIAASTGTGINGSSAGMIPCSINFLDSPATTSATTYKIQTQVPNTGSVYVNYDGSTAAGHAAFSSSITVMEVVA